MTASLSLQTVPFHGDLLEAAVDGEDRLLVSLRRCCEALGLDYSSQHKRLSDETRSPWACVVMMTIHDTSGRKQEACVIDLDTLVMWLATIDAGRVNEEARPKVVLYQKECAKVLRQHFFGDPFEQQLEQIRACYRQQKRVERLALQASREAQQARTDAASAVLTAHAALQTSEGNYGYYSVLGYANLTQTKLDYAAAAQHGRKLTALCRGLGVEVRKIRDPRFGVVNLYPESVLADYFCEQEVA